jgi:hypothetical protein
MAKPALVGRQPLAVRKPMEDLALQRGGITPNRGSVIINLQMLKRIGVETFVSYLLFVRRQT